MRKLIIFNNISLDGYFADTTGGLSWAHTPSDDDDDEYKAFVEGNASGGGQLLLGRITYELMVRYWPTQEAAENDTAIAEGMNSMQKIVFSRTLNSLAWNNSRIVKGDIVETVRQLKELPGEKGMAILGSGSIIAQLAPTRLIDEYQVVINPVVLGRGRTMFDGIEQSVKLNLIKSRTFNNGKIFLCYEPTASA